MQMFAKNFFDFFFGKGQGLPGAEGIRNRTSAGSIRKNGSQRLPIFEKSGFFSSSGVRRDLAYPGKSELSFSLKNSLWHFFAAFGDDF